MMLEAGANPDCRDESDSALNLSVWHNQIEIVEVFVKFGADINSPDGYGITPLHTCARKELPHIARMMLAAGADPNVRDCLGCSPIFHALVQDSIEMVELLLPIINLKQAGLEGNTVLHFVAQAPYLLYSAEYMRLLIEHGADLEMTNDSKATAFSGCAWTCNMDCLEIMIKAGCNLNAQNEEGETPLNMIAAMPEDNDNSSVKRALVCARLIEAGADVDIQNVFGASPIMNLVKHPNFSMIRQLLQANCCGTVTNIDDEDVIKKFMVAAIENKAEDCATFMFGESCSTEDLVFFWNLSLQPGAHLLRLFFPDETGMYAEKKQVLTVLENIGLSEPPLSLFRLCRLRVRSLLPKGPAFLRAVDQLDIPWCVKDFIAMRC